ncbi:MAG: FHA domain-containing protein [Bacteroidales bacterium]|nr:FHA domain-containing protein [Bacteroidales bacterium]
MIQCPECRALIPDDSIFCDQCGKELKWCPQCGRPKRGTECPVCGSMLVSHRGGEGVTSESSSLRDPVRVNAASEVTPSPAALVGNGWKLILQAGAFGRRGGIWPELATCPYVSGNHGVISKTASGWTISDSGSTNGTYVNEKRVAQGVAVELKIGDRVRIANLEFTVE